MKYKTYLSQQVTWAKISNEPSKSGSGQVQPVNKIWITTRVGRIINKSSSDQKQPNNKLGWHNNNLGWHQAWAQMAHNTVHKWVVPAWPITRVGPIGQINSLRMGLGLAQKIGLAQNGP